MTVSQASTKSRIIIKIICGSLTEFESKLLSILKFLIHKFISITYKDLIDQNYQIDYFFTTEDNNEQLFSYSFKKRKSLKNSNLNSFFSAYPVFFLKTVKQDHQNISPLEKIL